jgi:hypothetical protein
LNGQALLGSEGFVEQLRPHILEKDDLAELPVSQRLAHRLDFAAMLTDDIRSHKIKRDKAIGKAHLEYRYSMAAIARAAGIHYSTVSKVIKGER